MRRLVRFLVPLALASACWSSSAELGPTVAVDDDVVIALARACVVAGQEQVLEVRAPHPTVAVFQAIYSDGQGGGPPAGYGGEGSEIVPESGEVEMPWTIAEETPPGEVVVEVGILRGAEPEDAPELTFTLVGPQESCP